MKRRWWRLALPLLVLALLVLATGPAFARLGGGEGFGGGGGSSGGSGDDALLGCLIQIVLEILWELVIQHPKVGVPLVILLIAGYFVYSAMASKPDTPGSLRVRRGASAGDAPAPGAAAASVETTRPRTIPFAKLREIDPNFSRPLFLDFVVLLYMRSLDAGSKNDTTPIAPYMTKGALEFLASFTGRTKIEDVCVADAQIESVRIGKTRVAIDVSIEASFVQRGQDGAGEAQYSRERWTFERAASVLSKPPESIATLGCPSCGSPAELRPNGTCTSCDQVVANGRFHWCVTSVRVVERRFPRVSEITTGGGDEVGLDRPTVFASDLARETRAFVTRYPGFSFDDFNKLAAARFLALQEAWTRRDLKLARPHETDALFQAHRYWIERYRKEGITNVLEDVKVERVVLAKLDRDAFFEAATVRIYGSMKDWKRNDVGAVIAGDPRRARRFSEYWTFVRRQGFDPSKETASTKSCPSCGAPVSVTMAGLCEHCDAKVTSGSFGWVLARIDQDEVYSG